MIDAINRFLDVNVLCMLIAFTIPMPMIANNIAVGLFLLGVIRTLKKENFKNFNLQTFLVLSSLFFLYVFGLFYSENMSKAFYDLEKNAALLLFPLFLILYKKKLNLRFILLGLVASITLISVLCLFFISFECYKNGFSTSTLWKITNQPLSHKVGLTPVYQSMYIFLACISVLTLDKLNKKIVLFVILINSIVILFLASRVVLAIYIVTITVLIIRFFKDVSPKKRLVSGLLIVFVFGAVIYTNPVLKWRFSSVFANYSSDGNLPETKEKGVRLRSQLWSSCIQVIKDNPIIGVGSGDYVDALLTVYKEKKFRIPYRRILKTHNQYLTYTATFGVLGLTVFLFHLFWLFRLFFKHKSLLSLLYLSSVVIVCITESFLYGNSGIIFYAFFSNLLAINLINEY